jgi:hypothetical protein
MPASHLCSSVKIDFNNENPVANGYRACTEESGGSGVDHGFFCSLRVIAPR